MHLSFDPKLLVVLTLLLKTRSVTGTAAMLGISQPSVSRALQQLRRALNDPLLVRNGGGMSRTQRGDELVTRLADWMATTATLLDEPAFDPASIRRRFCLASTDFGVASVIAPALPGIHRLARDAALDVVPLSASPLRSLAAGEVDLVISGLRHDPTQFHRRHLFSDDFVCLIDRHHPLAGTAGPLPLATFLAHPHLGLTVSDAALDHVAIALGPAGRRRRVMTSLPYVALAADVLAGSDLVMTLPRRAARRFDDGPLATVAAPVEIGRLDYWMLWHERTHRDPASAWLRGQLTGAGHSPGG